LDHIDNGAGEPPPAAGGGWPPTAARRRVEMAVLVLPLAAVMALFAIFCFPVGRHPAGHERHRRQQPPGLHR